MEQQKEKKLIKICVGFSVVLHVFFIFIKFEIQSPPVNADMMEDQSLVIPVDFIDVEANEEKKIEFSVQKKILPQLPKKFKLTEKTKLETSLRKKKKSVIVTEKIKEIKRRKILELSKKEAFKRLMKEQARRKKAFKKKANIKLSKSLRKRRKELMQNKLSMGSLNNKYKIKIKQWVSKHYYLTEVYSIKDKKVEATFSLKIDQEGSINSLVLVKTSGDDNFDNLAMRVLRDSSPFPRPPDSWIGKAILFPFSSRR